MQARLLVLALVSTLTAASWSAEPVKQKINLMDVIKAGDVEYHVNPKMDFHDDPKDIWKVEGDEIHISGRGYGYVATKQSYRDYHLVIEFRWGDKTWGARETKARDNGLLVHAYGPHGAYTGTWMASIEAQIIEGGVGDILVLSPKLDDGTQLTTSVTSEFTLDRNKQMIWTKGAPRKQVTKGRINWMHRDPDWLDRKGFRGKQDAENPLGEWNRLEVVAKGDTLQYFVNGILVNEAFDVKPSEGRILLQSEGAQMIVRRFELYPLGGFTEKWNPIQASGGTDVPVREGQTKALSAEESLKQIQLDGPYEAQLVAAEPQVLDPVEVTWDEKGRMYVADMRDYPLGPPKAGDPWMSRILQLSDSKGDGHMDKSVVFADHLDNVQGLLPYKGGLIATTRTEVLFLKDTDGDGKADVIEPLIKGFNPRHAQLQVSAPRWGPDGCVYFNNGLDAKEIYPADPKAEGVAVSRCNFRWDPATGKIEATSGDGQYGGCFDDYGHHFFSSNRNPVMFAVMPYEAVIRNPLAGITSGAEDIAPFGGETRVFPVKITHTTADAHAGTNTAACGLGVYRGDLMPELKNNVFVCEPTAQLVTRYKVEPNGGSLKATRIGEHTEFFRSGDEWTRPVNFTTGPDGAIYICDMYRRYIDHARFFPEEFVKTHDMREGENQGRIWRIVPKGKKARNIEAAPTDVAGLKGWLNHDNAWQRETSRRLLADLGQPQPKGAHLPEAEGRKLFLELAAQSDGQESSDALVAKRIAAIQSLPEDGWITKAVLSASLHTSGAVLQGILSQGKFASEFSPQRAETVRSLASACAASGVSDDFNKALQFLASQGTDMAWWKPPFLQGLGEGLPKSGGKLGVKSLADLMAKPPAAYASAAKDISALMAQVETTAADPKAPVATRLAVLPLLAQRSWDKVQPVMRDLLATNQPPELTAAALALLKKFAIKFTEPLINEVLPKAGPAARGQLVAMLAASPASALELLKRMDRGEIPKAFVDVEKRWALQRGKGELRDLAVKLFGQPSGDRAAVIAQYMDCTTKAGNAKKGQLVFASICIACHKYKGQGVDVGPDITDIKAKPPEALLSDILDPNRMFEARWCAYQIDTKDGRSLSGIVGSESSDSVVLKMMGGIAETIQRSNIKEMKSLDRSLMPVGLETAVSKEQMVDLLAFLLGR